MVAGRGHGSAAKGLAIDLEVPVACSFSFPSSFCTMCSSLPCLSSTYDTWPFSHFLFIFV